MSFSEIKVTNPHNDISNEDVLLMLAGELTVEEIHERRAEHERKREVGRIQAELEIQLSKLSTPVLLKILRDRRRTTYYRSGQQFYDYRDRLVSSNEFNTHEATFFALKKLLAQRPHVPSTMEGKAARKAAATAHHGPKKRGGRTGGRGTGLVPFGWDGKKTRFRRGDA